ncbi:hypothetical protein CHLRE_09g409728v5 [Chlamydomonas reinhardtii]|uniref:Uncharacterized protein n=1 Tax=Chlamydomonas reinhardtii TaxID=3055 RepID=A0A2K3DFJ3_CHLRE|nr:uncharacterized protein CHLRE_09g409728v5 [Chlamydomonas reinhardtii]PNW79295.1 hypothetical protein CHLRE_09g409728v5 [Chlamydomonas reinhardtii]
MWRVKLETLGTANETGGGGVAHQHECKEAWEKCLWASETELQRGLRNSPPSYNTNALNWSAYALLSGARSVELELHAAAAPGAATAAAAAAVAAAAAALASAASGAATSTASGLAMASAVSAAEEDRLVVAAPPLAPQHEAAACGHNQR